MQPKFLFELFLCKKRVLGFGVCRTVLQNCNVQPLQKVSGKLLQWRASPKAAVSPQNASLSYHVILYGGVLMHKLEVTHHPVGFPSKFERSRAFSEEIWYEFESEKLYSDPALVDTRLCVLPYLQAKTSAFNIFAWPASTLAFVELSWGQHVVDANLIIAVKSREKLENNVLICVSTSFQYSTRVSYATVINSAI